MQLTVSQRVEVDIIILHALNTVLYFASETVISLKVLCILIIVAIALVISTTLH